jgi:cytochrome c peroxidase
MKAWSPSLLVMKLALLSACNSPVPRGPQTPASGVGSSAGDQQRSSQLAARAKEVFGSLPQPPVLPPELVALGQRLFFETRVSADGRVGCVTCHLPARWGTDGLPKSKGAFGRDNPRNAPTVFNAAYQFAEHWRADRDSVEDQARRALLGKPSFGLDSNEQAVQRLTELPGMPEAFRRAFPQSESPVTVENWGTAIGAYERTLTTPAALDAFMAGDPNALSARAQAGLATFLDVGCAGCHAGPLLGGRFTRVFGKVSEYAPLTHSDPVDQGRFDVTHEAADRFVFKVPPLRNVEKTGPYFHDGSVAALPAAVEIMAQTQLGTALSPSQVEDIVAFLASLTGNVPQTFAAPGETH